MGDHPDFRREPLTGRLIRADREPTFTEQARRKQIIGCAIEILAERGYSGASLAAIAERAGVSKGVISYHFAGKAELLEQVARAVYAAGAQYMQPRIQAEQTAAAMLAAYLRANLEFIRDHPQHMRAIAEIILNVRSGDGVLRLAGGREGIETVLDSVQSILRKGQQDGEFGEFDTRTMAWVVRAAIDSVSQQRALDADLDFDVAIRELTGLFDRATRAGGT